MSSRLLIEVDGSGGKATAGMAIQDDLFGQGPAAHLAVETDYGEVGKGASRAHYVLAENGSEYLIKGPAFTPEHPTVGGNEWVAARLADALGLPVLDHRIATMGGQLFFASAWMLGPSFSPALDESLFQRCRNRGRAYDVVVFDAWLANYDRHHENLVARRVARGSDEHLLLLNDHSHLLVGPGGPASGEQLLARLDAPPGAYVSLSFVRSSIVSAERLGQALGMVEALTDDFVREVVRSTPDELLPSDAREAYEDFLTQRRLRLRELYRKHKETFPNLDGDV